MEITFITGENVDYFSEVLDSAPNNDQFALGLIESDDAVGASVFSLDESICNIDHLFIKPEYRRKGFATALLNDVKQVLSSEAIGAIMCFFRDGDGLYEFLKKSGFSIVKADPIYSFKASLIENSSGALKLLSAPDNKKIVSFAEIVGSTKKALKNKLLENRFDPVIADDENYDGALSFAFLDESEVQGVILAFSDEKDIYITAALSLTESNTVMIALVSSFLKAVKSIGTENTKICFLSRNDSVMNFVTHLIGRDAADDEITQTYEAIIRL